MNNERDDLARIIEGQTSFLSTGDDQQDWYRARELASIILAAGYHKEAAA